MRFIGGNEIEAQYSSARCKPREKEGKIITAETDGSFSNSKSRCSSLEHCSQSSKCLGWWLAERKLELRVAEHGQRSGIFALYNHVTSIREINI